MKNTILILVIVVLLGLIGYAYVTIIAPNSNVEQTVVNSSDTEEVPTVNPNSIEALRVAGSGNDFVTAEALLRQGTPSYNSARSFYTSAKAQAVSPEQEAHIDYKIALTHTNINNEKSIELLKEIVADPEYPDYQKAFAVERIYLLYAMISHDPFLLDAVFAGEPYSEMYDPEDISMSLTRLAEFGLSYGSTPNLEMRAAMGYAFELPSLDIDDPLFNQYVATIETHVENFFDWIARNEGEPDSELIPKAYGRYLVVIGEMNRAGVPDTDDRLTDAIRTFYNIYDVYDIEQEPSDVVDAGNTYNAAAYALKAENREAWLIVEPYIRDISESIEQYGNIRSTLTHQRDGRYGGVGKPSFVASRYEPFRNMLLEIGWTEADFIHDFDPIDANFGR